MSIISDLPNSNSLANGQALTKPGVGLVSYRTNWKLVQPNQPASGVPVNDPTDASFNWSFLNLGVAQAAQYGKKVWIRINVQGGSSPPWLQALAQQYTGVDGKPFNIWWDTNYQAYLIAMIQAAGALYAANPLVAVVNFNIASDNVGDWTVPSVGASSDPTGAGNWTLAASFTCPDWGQTVTVTPNVNQSIHNKWTVFIDNFGWFQITGFTGPQTNPSTIKLLNLGVSGNAHSGTVPSTAIMLVSDVQNLTGPIYNYTTSRFVTAVTTILQTAQTAFPTQIVNQEVGRSGALDPFPAVTPPNVIVVQKAISNAGGSNPFTKSYSSNVHVNNSLYAAIAWNDVTTTVTGVTDSLNGDPWFNVSFISGHNRSLAVYGLNNTLGGACTLSVTLSAVPGTVQIALFEFSGTVSADAFATGQGGSTTTVTTPSILPGFSTDLVLAILAGGNPISGEAGWNFQTSNSLATQSILPGSTAAISSTFTQPSATFINTILSFQSSSGGYGQTFRYNAATQIAQWGYAHLPTGKFAIEKCTIQGQTESPASALSRQDASSLYLPAQTFGGSQNTSGTTGVIPPKSLFNAQFNWFCFDVTGQYSPTSTANANGPYAANGGVPYNQPLPVFNATVALITAYNATLSEDYEVDILNLISSASGTGNWGISFTGGRTVQISPTSDIINPGFNL